MKINLPFVVFLAMCAIPARSQNGVPSQTAKRVPSIAEESAAYALRTQSDRAIATGIKVGATPTANGAALAFTPSATTPDASVNIYRAPCTGAVTGTTHANGGIVGTCQTAPGSFVLIGNALPGIVNFTDASAGPAQSLAYQVTAVCPLAGCANGDSGESVPSNQIAVLTAAAQTYAIGTLPGSPASVSFTVAAGSAAPASQTITIIATPATPLPVTISADQPWITISSSSPTTETFVVVGANATGLAAGTYSGNVIATNTDGTASNSPFKIPVTLTIAGPAVSSKFAMGDTGKVQTGGANLNVHSGPAATASVVKTLVNNSFVTIVGGPTVSSGITFWEIGTNQWVEEPFVRQ